MTGLSLFLEDDSEDPPPGVERVDEERSFEACKWCHLSGPCICSDDDYGWPEEKP